VRKVNVTELQVSECGIFRPILRYIGGFDKGVDNLNWHMPKAMEGERGRRNGRHNISCILIILTSRIERDSWDRTMVQGQCPPPARISTSI